MDPATLLGVIATKEEERLQQPQPQEQKKRKGRDEEDVVEKKQSYSSDDELNKTPVNKVKVKKPQQVASKQESEEEEEEEEEEEVEEERQTPVKEQRQTPTPVKKLRVKKKRETKEEVEEEEEEEIRTPIKKARVKKEQVKGDGALPKIPEDMILPGHSKYSMVKWLVDNIEEDASAKATASIPYWKKQLKYYSVPEYANLAKQMVETAKQKEERRKQKEKMALIKQGEKKAAKSKLLPKDFLSGTGELVVAINNAILSECEKQETLLAHPDSELQCVTRFKNYMDDAIADRKACTESRKLAKLIVESLNESEKIEDPKAFAKKSGMAFYHFALHAATKEPEELSKATKKVEQLHKKRATDQSKKLNDDDKKVKKVKKEKVKEEEEEEEEEQEEDIFLG